MTILRWSVKADGTTVLQEYCQRTNAPSGSDGGWQDVPTVRKQREPREFALTRASGDANWRVQDFNGFLIHSPGERIRVREVLDER